MYKNLKIWDNTPNHVFYCPNTDYSLITIDVLKYLNYVQPIYNQYTFPCRLIYWIPFNDKKDFINIAYVTALNDKKNIMSTTFTYTGPDYPRLNVYNTCAPDISGGITKFDEVAFQADPDSDYCQSSDSLCVQCISSQSCTVNCSLCTAIANPTSGQTCCSCKYPTLFTTSRYGIDVSNNICDNTNYHISSNPIIALLLPLASTFDSYQYKSDGSLMYTSKLVFSATDINTFTVFFFYKFLGTATIDHATSTKSIILGFKDVNSITQITFSYDHSTNQFIISFPVENITMTIPVTLITGRWLKIALGSSFVWAQKEGFLLVDYSNLTGTTTVETPVTGSLTQVNSVSAISFTNQIMGVVGNLFVYSGYNKIDPINTALSSYYSRYCLAIFLPDTLNNGAFYSSKGSCVLRSMKTELTTANVNAITILESQFEGSVKVVAESCQQSTVLLNGCYTGFFFDRTATGEPYCKPCLVNNCQYCTFGDYCLECCTGFFRYLDINTQQTQCVSVCPEPTQAFGSTKCSMAVDLDANYVNVTPAPSYAPQYPTAGTPSCKAWLLYTSVINPVAYSDYTPPSITLTISYDLVAGYWYFGISCSSTCPARDFFRVYLCNFRDALCSSTSFLYKYQGTISFNSMPYIWAGKEKTFVVTKNMLNYYPVNWFDYEQFTQTTSNLWNDIQSTEIKRAIFTSNMLINESTATWVSWNDNLLFIDASSADFPGSLTEGYMTIYDGRMSTPVTATPPAPNPSTFYLVNAYHVTFSVVDPLNLFPSSVKIIESVCWTNNVYTYQLQMTDPTKTFLSVEIIVTSMTPTLGVSEYIHIHHDNIPGLLGIYVTTAQEYQFDFLVTDKITEAKQRMSFAVNCYDKLDLELSIDSASPSYIDPSYFYDQYNSTLTTRFVVFESNKSYIIKTNYATILSTVRLFYVVLPAFAEGIPIGTSIANIIEFTGNDSFTLALPFISTTIVRQILVMAQPKSVTLSIIDDYKIHVLSQMSLYVYVINNWNDCRIDYASLNTNPTSYDFIYLNSEDTYSVDLIEDFNINVSDENYFNVFFTITQIQAFTKTNTITTINSPSTSTDYLVSISTSKTYSLIIGVNSTQRNYNLKILVTFTQASSDPEASACQAMSKEINFRVYPTDSLISSQTIYNFQYFRFQKDYIYTQSTTPINIQITDSLVWYGTTYAKVFSFSNSDSNVTTKVITDISTKAQVRLSMNPSHGDNGMTLYIDADVINNSNTIDNVGLNYSYSSLKTEILTVDIFELNYPRSVTIRLRLEYIPKNKLLITRPSGSDLLYFDKLPWSFDLTKSYVPWIPEDSDFESSLTYTITTRTSGCPSMVLTTSPATISLPLHTSVPSNNCMYRLTVAAYYNQVKSVYDFKLMNVPKEIPIPTGMPSQVYVSKNNECYDLRMIWPESSISTSDWYSIKIDVRNNYVSPSLIRKNFIYICWEASTLPSTFTSNVWDNPFMNFFYLNNLEVYVNMYYSIKDYSFPLKVLYISSPLIYAINPSQTYFVPKAESTTYLVNNSDESEPLTLECIYAKDPYNLYVKSSISLVFDAGSPQKCEVTELVSVPVSSSYPIGNRLKEAFNVKLGKCNGTVNSGGEETAVFMLSFQVIYVLNNLTVTSVPISLNFIIVDAPQFGNCATSQNYFSSQRFPYNTRINYTFDIFTNNQLSSQASYSSGYGIQISPNPNNIVADDISYGNIFLQTPPSKPNNCAIDADPICVTYTHTVIAYFLARPSMRATCDITITFTSTQTNSSSSSSDIITGFDISNFTSEFSVSNFICEIGMTWSYDFASLVVANTDTPISDIDFAFENGATYGNFQTNDLTWTSKGILNWTCTELVQDYNGVLYPIESPEITVYAILNKHARANLLTFNIRPFRKAMLYLDTVKVCKDGNLGNFSTNRDYFCQFDIIKCQKVCALASTCYDSCKNDSTIFTSRTYNNMQITLDTILDGNFIYTIDSSTGYFKFKYINTSVAYGTINISITARLSETLKELDPEYVIVSDPFTFILTFSRSLLPTIVAKCSDCSLTPLQVYNEVVYDLDGDITPYILNVQFGSTINIIFFDSTAATTCLYCYQVNNCSSISYLNIINRPADMFIIETIASHKYTISYTNRSYSDLTIHVVIRNNNELGIVIVFKISTFFKFTISKTMTNQNFNDPVLIPLQPALNNSYQEIRLSDYDLILTKQQICMDSSDQSCHDISLTDLTSRIFNETKVFAFYPNEAALLGRRLLFTFTSTNYYKQEVIPQTITFTVEVPMELTGKNRFFNCEDSNVIYYRDPIIINAYKTLTQQYQSPSKSVLDICILSNDTSATLEIDQRYLPNKYKNFNGSALLQLTYISNTYSVKRYRLTWNVMLTFFSTGILRLNIIAGTGGAVLGSIHVIVYDTLPDYTFDFYDSRAKVSSFIEQAVYHTEIYSFNPKIYSYYNPLSSVRYGYDVLLEKNVGLSTQHNCLLPYLTTATVDHYNLLSSYTDYVWIWEEESTDFECSYNLYLNEVFYMYMYGQYFTYTLLEKDISTLKVNYIDPTPKIVNLYIKNARKMTLIPKIPPNLAPVYVLTSNESNAKITTNTILMFEEKQNIITPTYTFTLVVTNYDDDLKNQNFTLLKIEDVYPIDGFSRNVPLQKTEIPLDAPGVMTCSSALNDIKTITLFTCTWKPTTASLYNQRLLFTFNDNGVVRTKTIAICVGARCRYAPKSMTIVPTGCSRTLDVTQYNNNIFYSQCERGGTIIITNAINIEASKAVFKMGVFNLKFFYNPSINEYTITLPNIASSGCLPLFIYNDCPYDYANSMGLSEIDNVPGTGHCQLVSRVMYFFTFKANNAVKLTSLSPYLLNKSRTGDSVSINVYGENLSNDFQCFIRYTSELNEVTATELPYVQRSDTAGGCVLNMSNYGDKDKTGAFCIYLQYQYYIESGPTFSATNPSCETKQTAECLDVYLADFNEKVVTFSASMSVGHSYGGYLINLTISQLNFVPTTSAAGVNSIYLSSLVIQYGKAHRFTLDPNSASYANLINFVNSGTSLQFSLIVPPQFNEFYENTHTFRIAVSINDGVDMLQQYFDHTYEVWTNDLPVYYRNSTVTICPIGSYCPQSGMFPLDPILCDPGTYSPKEGLDSCYPCERGRMCPLEGMNATEPCYSGYFCREKTVFPERLCQGGFVCDTEMRENPGLFNEYNEPEGAARTYSCPAGYFCEEGTTSYVPVSYELELFGPRNISFYQQAYYPVNIETDVNITQTFPKAYYYIHNDTDIHTLWRKSHTPTQCIPAYDCSVASTRIWGQGACPPQSFCPLPFNKAETLAEIRTINSAYDCISSICDCPEGFECPTFGMLKPLMCPRGTYQDEPRSTQCKMCITGFYCETEGLISVAQLKRCSKGNYCPTGSSYQVSCPVNEYQDEEEKDTCKVCPKGKECKTPATVIPQNCSAGFICDFDDKSQYYRKPCNERFYCPVGTTAGQEIICPPGHFCPGATGSPIPCVEGTFMSNEGAVLCDSCPRGMYCPRQKLTSGITCDQGKWCSVSQLVFPDGNCTEKYVCGSGVKYTVTELEELLLANLTDFTPLVYDFNMTSDLVTWPLQCPKGYYCLNGTGFKGNNITFEPIPCGLNLYQSSEKSSSCIPCPEGFECTSNVNILPVPCPPGFYRGILDFQCTPCPKGTYLPMSKWIIPKECFPCEAGYICPYSNMTTSTDLPCKEGYSCNKGTSAYTPDILCSDGTFCLPTTISKTRRLEEADGNLCPAGRSCPNGTSANQKTKGICDKIKTANYTLSKLCKLVNDEERNLINTYYQIYDFCTTKLNYPQEINKFCFIGIPCPQNYYCPEGTGSVYQQSSNPPKPCRTGANSEQYSYNITHCILQFTSRYVFDSIDITLNDTKLNPTSSYMFKFNKTLFEESWYIPRKLQMGYDYDIIFTFNLDTADTINNQILMFLKNKQYNAEATNLETMMTYMLENESKPPLFRRNYVPFMKFPLLMDVFSNASIPEIDFEVLPSFKVYFKITLAAINPVIIEIENFKNAIATNNIRGNKIFTKTAEASSNFGFRHFIKLSSYEKIKVDSPNNLNVYPKYTADELSRRMFLNKLATMSFKNMTLLQSSPFIKNFTTFTVPQSVYDLTRGYWSNIQNQSLYTPILPYISDCDKLGSFIPLWRLLSYEDPNNLNNSCKILNPSDTVPVSIYIPTDPQGDSCELSFKCIYSDNLQEKSLIYNLPWIYAERAPLPIFQISSDFQVDMQQYFGIGDDFPSIEKYVEFIDVIAKTHKENVTGNYYPNRVNLTIYYYQVDVNTKKISQVNLDFDNLTKYISSEHATPLNRTYTFVFKLQAWSWHDCMNNFLFPITWYLVTPILIIAAFLYIIWMINLIAWRTHIHGGQPPAYTPILSFSQSYHTIIGVILSLVPLVPMILMFKYSYQDIEFGKLLFNYVVEKAKTNKGRIGGALVCTSAVGLVWMSKMTEIKISKKDPNLRRYDEDEIKEMKKNTKSQVLAFTLWILVFSFLTCIEYLACNYVLIEMDNLFPNMSITIVMITQTIVIQFINFVINAPFIYLMELNFLDYFYVVPFKILGVFIVKAMQLQTKSFVYFIIGYIQQSVINSLVQRLFLQSLLPIFQMKIEDKKKKKMSLKLRAETYAPDEAKKEKLMFQILSGNSVQIVSTLAIVILILIKYLFYEELALTGKKDFYFYYIILTVFLTIAEIPLDILVANTIECWSSLDISKRIMNFKARFAQRKRAWVINDLSHHTSSEHKNMAMIEKLGFSWQYYFILSFNCMCVIISCIGIDLMTSNYYNPFKDMWMPVNLIMLIGYFSLLNYGIKLMFKLFDEKNVKYERVTEKKCVPVFNPFCLPNMINNIQTQINTLSSAKKKAEEIFKEKIPQEISKNFQKYQNIKLEDLYNIILAEVLSDEMAEAGGGGNLEGNGTSRIDRFDEFMNAFELNHLQCERDKLENEEKNRFNKTISQPYIATSRYLNKQEMNIQLQKKKQRMGAVEDKTRFGQLPKSFSAEKFDDLGDNNNQDNSESRKNQLMKKIFESKNGVLAGNIRHENLGEHNKDENIWIVKKEAMPANMNANGPHDSHLNVIPERGREENSDYDDDNESDD